MYKYIYLNIYRTRYIFYKMRKQTLEGYLIFITINLILIIADLVKVFKPQISDSI